MNWRLVGGWLAALTVSTIVTWQIVGVADSRVNAQPVEISAPVASSSTTTQPNTSTSAPPGSVQSTSTTDSTSTTQPTASSSSTTSTSTPGSTTTEPDEWKIRTINTLGGVVVVQYRYGEVELKAATPLPGFGVEVDDSGPPKVRVEFDSSDLEIRVDVEWDHGALDIEVTEND